MAGVFDYSTTAGSNGTVGGVNIAEGMAPSGVNNAMRAMMADTRKLQLDQGGSVITAGSGNTYTFASNTGLTAYATGQRLTFEADKTNTGAATLNVDGVGAKSIKTFLSGVIADAPANAIIEGCIYDVAYEAGADSFILLNPSVSLAAYGVTASAAELNVLDGVTATTAELNILDGVTATASELNILDGATVTAAELNLLDGATAGTSGQVLTSNGTFYAPRDLHNGSAAVAASSGASADITGIPAWATKVRLHFLSVSAASAASMRVRLGTASGFETTGYIATASRQPTSGNVQDSTTGFLIDSDTSAAYEVVGFMEFIKVVGTDTWFQSHVVRLATNSMSMGAGVILLPGALTQLRVFPSSGNFDGAGTIQATWW